MRFLVSTFLALSVAIGAGGEWAAQPCPHGCCCGLEGPCQCGHEDFGGGGLGGQNDIPAIPPMPCNTGCANHAAGSIAALGDYEIKVVQKSSGKAGAEKPNSHFAPFCLSKIITRDQPIIEHMNLRRAPLGQMLGFEEISTRLAFLATFRK
ncbi:MAG: hypothetical protein LBC63_04385 [Holophagales bacterium]|nr:hypothetical protein [Holophagales bacterium]